MSTKPRPCHHCGDTPTVYHGSYWGNSISCDNCYDGASDSRSRNEHVDAPTLEEAVRLWDTMQEELREEELPGLEAWA